ncbi:hypothetical protein SLE2022_319940 [Rubroshorea leprosula]
MTTDVALVIREERVEEMRELYVRALENGWKNIKTLNQTKHSDLFSPLTPCGDTGFHIAAYMGSIDLLRVVFKMAEEMSRKCEVFTMKNSHGNTLLHESNKFKAVKFLVDEIAH